MFGILPAFLALTALVFSLISNFWCRSHNFKALNKYWPTWQFGIWRYRHTTYKRASVIGDGGDTWMVDRHSCHAYPGNTKIDGAWKAARVFSILSTILGTLILLSLLAAPFVFRHKLNLWRMLALLTLLLMPLFQGLTFLILRSDMCRNNNEFDQLGNSMQGYDADCRWDTGSTFNLISVLLWFLVGLLMMVCHPHKKEETVHKETEVHTTTYQQTAVVDNRGVVAATPVTVVSTDRAIPSGNGATIEASTYDHNVPATQILTTTHVQEDTYIRNPDPNVPDVHIREQYTEQKVNPVSNV
jgi:hypothetical protein